MKVLHITTEYPPMTNGGIANAAFGIVSASVNAGINADVIFIGASNPWHGNQLSRRGLDQETTSNEQKIFLIPWSGFVEECVDLVKKIRPDLLHLHTFLLFPVAHAIKKLIGTPMVYTVHAFERTYIHKNPLDYLLQSQTQDTLISLVDHVIVLSQTDKELLLYYGMQNPNQIWTVGNGAGTHLGLSIENSRDSHLVLFVGRYDNNKGIDDLLTAIPYVVQRDPQVSFVLVGGPLGIKGEEMQRQWLSSSFPCKEWVTFTGWIPTNELTKLYSKAGILVVPSSYDTFPLVILDGMQHGLTVIASSIGGALDIIKHEKTGLLFAPKDVGSLVTCIVRLLKDSNLQHQIGTAAAKEIQNNWLWPNIVDKLLVVYEKAIQMNRQ